MSDTFVLGTFEKPKPDKRVFRINWSDILLEEDIECSDKLASSTWAYASDSPKTTGVLADFGFDKETNLSWLSIDAGDPADVFYINNTITTTGTVLNGVQMPSQTIVRQIRVKIKP